MPDPNERDVAVDTETKHNLLTPYYEKVVIEASKREYHDHKAAMLVALEDEDEDELKFQIRAVRQCAKELHRYGIKVKEWPPSNGWEPPKIGEPAKPAAGAA